MVSGNDIEYGALRRILQLSAGTSTFTMVACSSPSLRESLCQRLLADGLHFHEAHLGLGTTDPVAASRAAIPPDATGAVFITGLDYLLADSTPGSDHLLAVLNRSRERWRAAFPGTALVFWLTQHTVVRVLTHGPDLRAWVSHELEFTGEHIGPAVRMDHGSLSRNYTWLSNLDAPAKRARLAELEQRLTGTTPDPALFQEWARSWDEKLYLLQSLGENVTAEQQATALLQHYPEGDEAALPWRAETFDHLATLLAIRGETDEALRIRREEQLPVIEKLGDARLCAVEQGKIADILKARGQLDEALRILREELLPVFEKLGDVRSRAVTMGKIADILMARGQLDEALRIRREEELPVYEKLGDVRSRAVTMGQIADILSARGQLDEALRIRREEQLPVYEKLGDVRALIVGRTNIAMILAQRGHKDDGMEIITHIAWAWREARRMGLPEAGQIEKIAGKLGLTVEILAQFAEKV